MNNKRKVDLDDLLSLDETYATNKESIESEDRYVKVLETYYETREVVFENSRNLAIIKNYLLDKERMQAIADNHLITSARVGDIINQYVITAKREVNKRFNLNM